MKNENKKLENLITKVGKATKLGSWLKNCKFLIPPPDFTFFKKILYIFADNKFTKIHLENRKKEIQQALTSLDDYQVQIEDIKEYDWIYKELYFYPKVLSELPDPDKKDFQWLKAIDLLRIIPEFEKSVSGIRKKYNIDPKDLKQQLEKFLGKKQYFSLIETEQAVMKFRLPKTSSHKYEEIENKIKSWEQKQFPLLLREIGKLRLIDFGKIPLSWNDPIKDYILYNKISNYPFLSRESARWPKLATGTDPQTLEPYIQIKIYGETNLGFFRSIRRIEKFQKLLPTYKKINQKIYNTSYRRWIYYFLRKKVGYKHSETNKYLKEVYGFKPIDYQYGSQELKRFETLFKKSKNKRGQ